MTRHTILAALLHASAAAALLFAGCTTLLGDDFELASGGSGGTGQAGHSTGAGGTTSGGQGGTGGVGDGGGGSDPCGNGEPDPGETCDGDCPEECIDADYCTDDHMVGSPDECTAACPFEGIDTCVDNDGCCPNGCYNSIDDDCDMRVLIVTADINGQSALEAALDGSGAFGQVESFDAAAGTPTLTELSGHDAVLVTANWQGFANPVALGNALADYYDQGGRVVVSNGANCTSYALAGRFVTDGYLVLEIGDIHPGDDPLGTIEVPNTPLMEGSTGFVGYGHCDGAAVAGAVVVARYEVSGDPVVAYRWLQDRRRVDLNIYPPPVSGAEGIALLVNALKFQ